MREINKIIFKFKIDWKNLLLFTFFLFCYLIYGFYLIFPFEYFALFFDVHNFAILIS